MNKIAKQKFDKLNTNKINLILNYLNVKDKFELLLVSKRFKIMIENDFTNNDTINLLEKVLIF